MTGKIVLDSDALIELARAGLLGAVTRAWRCLVPEEVYEETVVRGRERGHPDAEDIATAFGRGLERRRVRKKSVQGMRGRALGPGELAAAALLVQEGADAVVTDDQAFLQALRGAGLPYTTPALLVVDLVRTGTLSKAEARVALARLRRMIREDQYRLSLAQIEAVEE